MKRIELSDTEIKWCHIAIVSKISELEKLKENTKPYEKELCELMVGNYNSLLKKFDDKLV